MILDASFLIATMAEEPGWAELETKGMRAPEVLIPGPTVLEAMMVAISRFGDEGRAMLAEILDDLRAEVVAFDASLLSEAAIAFERFGKGRHPAALNFGDCMVYALAKKRKIPVLCTGTDFEKTDISVA